MKILVNILLTILPQEFEFEFENEIENENEKREVCRRGECV